MPGRAVRTSRPVLRRTRDMEAATVYWGYIGIMENKMETTTVDWDYGLVGSLGFRNSLI